MKKLFLIFLMVGFAISTNAQEIKLGLKGGANFSNYIGDNVDGASPILGYHFGSYVNVNLSDKFAIQAEVLFSEEGAKFDLPLVGETFWISQYLNIPVLAKFYATEGLSFHAGPQVGILLSSTLGGDDVKDNYKSTNISALIGMGYELENGINFGARYNLGLSSVAEDKDTDVRTTNIQIYAGYSF